MQRSVTLIAVVTIMLLAILSISLSSSALGRVVEQQLGPDDSSWEHIGPDGVRVNDISVASDDNAFVIAAIEGDVHLAKTTNGGATWMYMENSPTNLLAVQFDPVLPTSMYVGNDSQTFRSSDGGESWGRQLSEGTDTSDFWIKSDDRQHVLVATTDLLARPYGVYLNQQYGWGSWTRTFAGKSLTLAGDPNDASHVYVGTHDSGSVNRSTNGGSNWSLVSPSGAWVEEVRDLEIDWAGNIFAATNDGLWRKTGSHWTQLSGLPSADITDLAIGLSVNPGIVYAGTAAHGVFISNDSGNTWSTFNTGLSNLDITRLEIGKSVLYAGTASNGVWKIALPGSATATPTPTETSAGIAHYLPLILKAWQRPTPMSTPTITPTPTRTPTSPSATDTPTITPTSPVTNTPTATPTQESDSGIYGVVTYKSTPVSNVIVSLVREEEGDETVIATATTNDDGEYLFNDTPTLQPGQRYFVRFGPNQSNSRYLMIWFGPYVSTYTAGESTHGSDFDIEDVRPVLPSNNATSALPLTFIWDWRSYPADTYGFRLFDLTTFDNWTTGDIGHVDSFVLKDLPSGVSFGTAYGWNPMVYNGDDAFGIPYYYRNITFSETSTANSYTRPAFAPSSNLILKGKSQMRK
ncbi:MAG: hypothetical protein J5I90_13025 [Caldilineales bacterium]|nr:hypothetical protein [Caldilineales bacterium]